MLPENLGHSTRMDVSLGILGMTALEIKWYLTCTKRHLTQLRLALLSQLMVDPSTCLIFAQGTRCWFCWLVEKLEPSSMMLKRPNLLRMPVYFSWLNARL